MLLAALAVNLHAENPATVLILFLPFVCHSNCRRKDDIHSDKVYASEDRGHRKETSKDVDIVEQLGNVAKVTSALFSLQETKTKRRP